MRSITVGATAVVLAVASATVAQDACATIGGQKWAAPADVRACYTSFALNTTLRDNIIEVVNKTMLTFHASTNYQVQAPEPYADDVHEDVLADLAKIQATEYATDYEAHIAVQQAVARLQDGHCVWRNYCFDSAFVNYLPTPLVLLTDSEGVQNVHIAPEAFSVASLEFPDQIDVWQEAVGGELEALSGAQVLAINGADPWEAVEANAAVAGSYQARTTRQNAFFASYQRSASSWTYIFGQFAQQSLPLSDEVTLTVLKENATEPEDVTIPYRSRIGSTTAAFTDSASYFAGNCLAQDGTNGYDYYYSSAPSEKKITGPKHLINAIVDEVRDVDAVLPEELQPQSPLDGSYDVAQYYMLDDVTGVMALGSFSAGSYNQFLESMLTGLTNLKSAGATQLIVDVYNNGGGYICAAHWLHRIIAGPKSTTEPQAGLNTTTRAQPLARAIVESIINGSDPNNNLLYNPINWRALDNEFFTESENWLEPPVEKEINGRVDYFSQTLGNECQPEGFLNTVPEEALFDPTKVAIVSNGRCASSCSLFSVTMAKLEGAKTVVVGGKADTEQQYCGIIGGQSTSFATMDSEVKTAGLKDNELAPPDLLVNGYQGVTWRLGYGIDKPDEPEEWQDRPADLNLPLTKDIVNKPEAIWAAVAASVF
ncbi:hypothetical protein BD626DRAFT_510149 [Schizophyllum amplum]|uniref:Tail specific protease domain-containing protein n=1 Tax=Schizophyllum amplum TaxID=97359 RepID=A0A550C2A7_9AGAR|nr:hypothetical protein BD626DRAFT_510149 [Auriculariopsis ampla]